MRRIYHLISNYPAAVAAFTRNARLYLAANFLIGLSFAFSGVIFNLYLAQAGFQEGFIGTILSLGGLALVLSAVPAGMASDRFGRKKTMVWGVAAGSLIVLLRALTVDRIALITLGFMGGISGTVFNISAAPFMMDNSRPQERTQLFSMSFAVMLAAGILGNLIAGKLPGIWGLMLPGTNIFQRYRLTLLMGALLSFAALIPLLRIEERPVEAGPKSKQDSPQSRSGFIQIARFSWCNWWIGLGAGLVIPFFNLYFSKRFNASSGQIGLYFSVSQVVTLAAVLAGPALARRLGKVRTVALMELLSLPFLITLGFERNLGIAVISFWMRASLMQMASPISNSFTMELIPEGMRAQANSWTMIAWNLSWTVSAAASGWMMQRWGYAVPYYLTAACYAVSAVSYYLMFRRYDKMGTGGSQVLAVPAVIKEVVSG
jgi:MFS family permease